MKDLVVHVDNTPQCARRVRLAARLAADFSARLNGVYARHVPLLPADEGSLHGIEAGAVTTPERIEYGERVTHAEASAAEEIFRAGSTHFKVSVQWHTMAGSGADVVVAYARYTDLAVVGQTLSGGENIAAEVALRSGRPVLVAPVAEEFSSATEHALIAWDASRESARALHDALPLLRRAKRVSLLSVGPPEKTPPGMNIAAHLSRHGVAAEVAQEMATTQDAGAALLERAASLACDLIVMGAYGHSRLRERVLGGTTRHVLKHMTVPVLIAH